jgi:Cofactor assembly of complex C subunit B, CCB2/CCB4
MKNDRNYKTRKIGIDFLACDSLDWLGERQMTVVMRVTLTYGSLWLLINLVISINLNDQHVWGFLLSKNVQFVKRYTGDGCGNPSRLFDAAEDPVDRPTSATVRFTSLSVTTPSTENPIDSILYWITSDIGSIILGGVGLILLLVGRLALDGINDPVEFEVSGEQTRSNLLAVFAVVAVLLNGLSQLDVQSVLAEKVVLVGSIVAEPIIQNTDSNVDSKSFSWVLSSTITATPATTAVLLIYLEDTKMWKPMAFVGVVPPNLLSEDPNLPAETPIMDRMRRLPPPNTKLRESYLPTLQALPGRTEFTNYLLPFNTQAALLLPLTVRVMGPTSYVATLLLGSNQARSFSPRDIAWCQTAATRLELEV